jgi:hypothetical protein
MRALRALFRGWLNHPWRAFWLTVVAFYAGLFSLVLVAPFSGCTHRRFGPTTVRICRSDVIGVRRSMTS